MYTRALPRVYTLVPRPPPQGERNEEERTSG
jgi:hypothetical protein